MEGGHIQKLLTEWLIPIVSFVGSLGGIWWIVYKIFFDKPNVKIEINEDESYFSPNLSSGNTEESSDLINQGEIYIVGKISNNTKHSTYVSRVIISTEENSIKSALSALDVEDSKEALERLSSDNDRGSTDVKLIMHDDMLEYPIPVPSHYREDFYITKELSSHNFKDVNELQVSLYFQTTRDIKKSIRLQKKK